MSDSTGTAGQEYGQEYWDDRYSQSERLWSGEPNAALVAEIAEVPPGRVLDLGSGEGGDAVWLARAGWHVTAVDISAVALERTREGAEGHGVAERVDLQRHDLAESFPDGEFDLVSACFLHSRGDMPREQILRTAASRVAPGGLLLIVGHSGHAPGEEEGAHEVELPAAARVLESLGLAEQEWQVLLSQEREREHTGPGGHHTDSIVKVRRR